MVLALILHIGGGILGILSGWAAVSVRKGGRLHQLFGTVFFVSMLTMAGMGAVMAAVLGQAGNVIGGTLTFYMVATAWATVRRPAGQAGVFEKVALSAAFGCALVIGALGLRAAGSPGGALGGVPAPVYFVMAGVGALAGSLDLKVVLNGGISGVARISRHLWRMCLGWFMASASFFLGQQKVMPSFMHGSPILLALGVAPLLVLLFWLIRVRFPNAPWRRPAIASQPGY